MERAILAAGERHLARDGAAALSLRAIARDLGVASSAELATTLDDLRGCGIDTTPAD